MRFYKLFFALAIPVALQEMIGAALNMLDNIMIGVLGKVEIAGVGIANQFYFLLILATFGLCGGASVFFSQYWGVGDEKTMNKVLRICLLASFLISSIFMTLALAIPHSLIAIFSNDTMVIETGAQYLKAVCPSYLLTAVTMPFAFYLRSKENPRLPLITSIIAFTANSVLNYVLIFGKFGFPALGVTGAAIATVIARLFEMLILLIAIYKKKYAEPISIYNLFNISKPLIKDFFKTSSPVILNELGWSMGMTSYLWVFGQMGTDVMASTNIYQTILRLSMVIMHGVGSAALVMIGKSIGKGSNNAAFVYAKRFLIISFWVGLGVGVVLAMSSGLVLAPYNVDAQIKSYTREALIATGIFMCFKCTNCTNIIGVFRSGGDTTFSMFLDIGGVFLIGFPLAYLGGIVFHLPIFWVYCMLMSEEVVKFVVGTWRFLTKKWINNIVSS